MKVKKINKTKKEKIKKYYCKHCQSLLRYDGYGYFCLAKCLLHNQWQEV